MKGRVITEHKTELESALYCRKVETLTNWNHVLQFFTFVRSAHAGVRDHPIEID